MTAKHMKGEKISNEEGKQPEDQNNGQRPAREIVHVPKLLSECDTLCRQIGNSLWQDLSKYLLPSQYHSIDIML